MEKVQFQLESTLPELKDLHEKGLFSRHEIAEITKRRTAFETALVRRQARKDDFFKYAEYEINLEKLRKIRWKKLKYDRNPPPPSASTYSIPRRTLYILKRATAKFPGELAVWLAYVEYAAREGMTKVVAKGLTSALQHHPLSPTLYLLQSYHHLHPGLPLPRSDIPSSSSLALPSTPSDEEKPGSAFALEGTGPARTTLLLGLRMLPASHSLWREYAKLELGWVEALRRRWRALGIEATDSTFDGDGMALAGGEGSFGPEGEEARRAILSGQLVLQAVSEALKKVTPESTDPVTGVDGIAFRDDLLRMLRSYPSPLRTKAQEAVYADLERNSNSKKESEETQARARMLLITRGLYDRPYEAGEERIDGVVLKGVALVDAYAAIGKELKGASGALASTAGLWLLSQLPTLDAELRPYVLGLVSRLTKKKAQPSPELLLADLAARAAYAQASLDVFRSHAANYPSNPILQLALVNAEVDASEASEPGAKSPGELKEMFKAATSRVTGRKPEEQDAIVQLWSEWSLIEDDLRPLLLASLRVPVPGLHSRILATYFFTLLSQGASPAEALKDVQKYTPSAEFFKLGFEQLAQLNGEEGAMRDFYETWKRNAEDGEVVDAALTYARWLVERRKGRDARVVVETAKRQARGREEEIETGWARILDEAEREDDEDLDEEIESSDEDEEDEEGGVEDVEMGDEDGSEEEEEEEEAEDSHEGSSDLEIAM